MHSQLECQWQSHPNGYQCEVCGVVRPGPRRRRCLGRMELGNYLEKHLQKWGITPDRYVAVKKEIGFPPSCNCAGRKEWLNKLDRWVREQMPWRKQ